MDFIAGAISDVFDKAERDATAKFDKLAGVTRQQGVRSPNSDVWSALNWPASGWRSSRPRRPSDQSKVTPAEREGPALQRGEPIVAFVTVRIFA